MSKKFCRELCGACASCKAAQAELDELEAVYASLSDEDAASLNAKDPDDPRSYALDSKGRP